MEEGVWTRWKKECEGDGGRSVEEMKEKVQEMGKRVEEMEEDTKIVMCMGKESKVLGREEGRNGQMKK